MEPPLRLARGDSHDNALAEAVNGLYKAELIHRLGPWRSLEQVELATAAIVVTHLRRKIKADHFGNRI
jgi:hypothetical protein